MTASSVSSVGLVDSKRRPPREIFVGRVESKESSTQASLPLPLWSRRIGCRSPPRDRGTPTPLRVGPSRRPRPRCPNAAPASPPRSPRGRRGTRLRWPPARAFGPRSLRLLANATARTAGAHVPDGTVPSGMPGGRAGSHGGNARAPSTSEAPGRGDYLLPGGGEDEHLASYRAQGPGAETGVPVRGYPQHQDLRRRLA
jgi:hypothetical protein